MTIKNVDVNQFGFFVRDCNEDFDPKTGIANNLENTLNGTANMRDCRVVSWDNHQVEKFIENAKQVYKHVECVQVPENSDFTVEEINKRLNLKAAESKTDIEKVAAENEDLKAEMKKLQCKMAELLKKQKSEKEEEEEEKPTRGRPKK